MKTRGEKQYIDIPVFATKWYDNLTSVKGVNKGFKEIYAFVEKKSDDLADVSDCFDLTYKEEEVWEAYLLFSNCSQHVTS